MTDSTQDLLRGTGRTTWRILNIVRTAIANAGTLVEAKDHEESIKNNAHVLVKVCAILDILNVHYERDDIHVMVTPMEKEE